MLVRSDPFRDLDRWLNEAVQPSQERRVPMDAYRRGEELVLHFDVPGVEPDAIELSVENDVLRVTASREWSPKEGDELYARERSQGQFSRQVIIGKSVDTAKVSASCHNGVLTVRLPVAETARKRRIDVRVAAPIEASSHPAAAGANGGANN